MAKYHCEIYDRAGFVTFVSNPVILISQPSLERPVLRQKVIAGRKHVENMGGRENSATGQNTKCP